MGRLTALQLAPMVLRRRTRLKLSASLPILAGSIVRHRPEAGVTIRITLIGGPTALIEAFGFRLLTDPTFDGPGDYRLPHVTLTKTSRPAVAAAAVGPVDAVLLSHDQRADNLDHAGRDFLATAPRVLTTVAGAQRLAGRAEGLAPWQTTELIKADGSRLRVTATPARHGPAGIEPFSGDVIGFVISFPGAQTRPIYVTGDTVWYDGVAEVARRFPAGLVLLFAGAAQTRGPFHLTMDTNDAIETAHAFPDAVIVPLHCAGWAHFTQSCDDLKASFAALGIASRLRLLEAGVAAAVDVA
jgi:L-ascorbate metabolism protein UlaG (beta-lactamase superfamily)